MAPWIIPRVSSISVSRRDWGIGLFFLALAALYFAPVLFGNATLIPFDNLFRFPPWRAFASQFGVTIPYNELASDLLLENYAWKQFLVESLRAKEIPLWNPYLFGGVPFLAAGQHSALYPFSILFYFLPLERAFGVFVASQFALAAFAMFALMRVFGISRFAATLSAITYAFSAFFFVSVTFPMVIAAAAWLPAILACAELVIHSRDSARQIFFALLGAIFVGIQFLAGHVEISMYILIVTAFFAAWRVLQESGGRRQGQGSAVSGCRGIITFHSLKSVCSPRWLWSGSRWARFNSCHRTNSCRTIFAAARRRIKT